MALQGNDTISYEKIISLGYSLYKDLDGARNTIKGIAKLRRKINQEICGVEKAKKANSLKLEQLNCSNLHHYEAFVRSVLNDKHCVSVLEGFPLEDNGTRRKIYVDIVTEGGRKWKKVIARNPKALSQISVGEGEYQQKSIVDHAGEFIACAKQNIIYFKPPKVEFFFACGIEKDLANTLSSFGIIVTGDIIGNEILKNELEIDEQNTSFSDVNKLNLDVSAMIAYVSSLTNGNAHKKLKGKILNHLAECERKCPLKPILDKFFEGKELFACERAISDFKSIVSIVGGEEEKKRANELFARLSVVEDCLLDNLEISGQVKERGLAVFGTGQNIQAITVTSNSSFVRAALTRGIHLDVFIHEPRSLTEQKELSD